MRAEREAAAVADKLRKLEELAAKRKAGTLPELPKYIPSESFTGARPGCVHNGSKLPGSCLP